ncbi:MAG: DUF2844 domain-containing protein, partial [Ramlibacter sp.]
LPVVLVAAGSPALASLGGPLSTGLPQAGPPVVEQVAPAGGGAYTHVQRQLDSGTVVREFADADGTVFAVSWNGPFLPDLRELLGPTFAVLQDSAARGRTSALSISRPDLVLVSAGHMRGFEGRAWLPPKLPAGFDPRQLP